MRMRSRYLAGVKSSRACRSQGWAGTASWTRFSGTGERLLILFPEGTRVAQARWGVPERSFSPLRAVQGNRSPPVYTENLNRVLPEGEVLPVPLLMPLICGGGLQLEEGTQARVLEKAFAVEHCPLLDMTRMNSCG